MSNNVGTFFSIGKSLLQTSRLGQVKNWIFRCVAIERHALEFLNIQEGGIEIGQHYSKD